MALERSRKPILFPKSLKAATLLFVVVLIVLGLKAYQLYFYVYNDNVKHDTILMIPQGAGFNQVADSLKSSGALINYKSFIWVAHKKHYDKMVKPGRYFVEKGRNNNDLVDMLRVGKQQPVEVTFNNLRSKEQFAGAVGKYIEADSTEVLKIFSDTALIRESGFTPETFIAMFIPNTYEVLWTTTPLRFARRMKTEYDNFWNEQRKAKAGQLGLSPVEVSILASIVQEETNKNEEKPVVAGLYLNRLKRGMPLQADPTVRYAVGDFTIKRILNSHLETESPYNTYKYAGLPPGPINFPEISSIDAVLNYKKTNYLYMCAKEDFSGYHSFARTLAEHNRNAERYRFALDTSRIFK
jgi:UPF0755 protein